MNSETEKQANEMRTNFYKDFDVDQSPEALTLCSTNPEEAAQKVRIVFEIPYYEYEKFAKSSLLREIVRYFDLIKLQAKHEIQLILYRLW